MQKSNNFCNLPQLVLLAADDVAAHGKKEPVPSRVQSHTIVQPAQVSAIVSQYVYFVYYCVFCVLCFFFIIFKMYLVLH